MNTAVNSTASKIVLIRFISIESILLIIVVGKNTKKGSDYVLLNSDSIYITIFIERVKTITFCFEYFCVLKRSI